MTAKQLIVAHNTKEGQQLEHQASVLPPLASC